MLGDFDLVGARIRGMVISFVNTMQILFLLPCSREPGVSLDFAAFDTGLPI